VDQTLIDHKTDNENNLAHSRKGLKPSSKKDDAQMIEALTRSLNE